MATKQNQKQVENFFKKMFMDDNDINEKSVVGFSSFIMMVICFLVDIITGAMGKHLTINEFIYDGFLWITLGAFGIASVDKYLTSKNSKNNDSNSEETGI